VFCRVWLNCRCWSDPSWCRYDADRQFSGQCSWNWSFYISFCFRIV